MVLLYMHTLTVYVLKNPVIPLRINDHHGCSVFMMAKMGEEGKCAICFSILTYMKITANLRQQQSSANWWDACEYKCCDNSSV